jgi:hypothetical protein
MDYGKVSDWRKGHRPMYPEYPFRRAVFYNLGYLENGKVYNWRGRLLSKPEDASELVAFMRDTHTCVYVPNLLYGTFAPQYLYDLTNMEDANVLADKKGKPLGVHLGHAASTRWVVSLENWDEVPEPEALGRIWDVQKHYGVGYAPTKSSLGSKFSRYIYTSRNLGHHTAPSLDCESFIREHGVGQGVATPGVGRYDVLRLMDVHAAFLRYWYIHPTGTAVRFTDESSTEYLATYFARCTVTIHDTLPLGPFPQVGIGEKHQRKVYYPTKPGKYEYIYISKEQVADCREAGCTVNVYEGFGWKEFTTDNIPFARESYLKREVGVPSNAEDTVKAIPLAFMGKQAQGRNLQFLVSLERAEEYEPIVVDNEGKPFPYALRTTTNHASALMIHWWWYTVTECNRAVYNFALKFAKQGRLVAIDYDSIMVLDGPDGFEYYQKYTIAEVFAHAGDWKWRLLHNVNVIGDRTFESDELTHKPGNSKAVELFVDNSLILPA